MTVTGSAVARGSPSAGVRTTERLAGCVSVEFDRLPAKSRALILATLGLEIASKNCTSIFDLARRRNQTMDELWRDICRKTAQPHCSMPRDVLSSRYTA